MIALATWAGLPEGFQEDELRERLGAAWAVWDDPAVDWDAFDLVVVRSCWDYDRRRDEFLAWARSVPRLANPAAVLAFSSDKAYLGELAAAGLPTIPTRFLAPGEALEVPVAEGDELVVKPSVSAGSRLTGRFRAGADDEAARELLAEIHASGRTAMVQPYVTSVDARGETALLFAGGELSHAAAKPQLLERGTVSVDGVGAAPEIVAREPTPDEQALGERVVAWAVGRFGPLAYARVDLVEGPAGEPMVLELELCEPNLFLTTAPGAAEAFAAAFREAAAELA